MNDRCRADDEILSNTLNGSHHGNYTIASTLRYKATLQDIEFSKSTRVKPRNKYLEMMVESSTRGSSGQTSWSYSQQPYSPISQHDPSLSISSSMAIQTIHAIRTSMRKVLPNRPMLELTKRSAVIHQGRAIMSMDLVRGPPIQLADPDGVCRQVHECHLIPFNQQLYSGVCLSNHRLH